jgi:hypothetical protein
MIKMWLIEYGTLMSDLTEDKIDLELSSEEEEAYQGVELTTGNYSVKMRLAGEIPQYLPCNGKKIRIYHRESKNFVPSAFTQATLKGTAIMMKRIGLPM